MPEIGFEKEECVRRGKAIGRRKPRQYGIGFN
jgi:hypothetical protein